MSHPGTMTTCPVCTGPAHACADGNIYCGDADVTMTPQQVAEALTAADIAAGIKAGMPLWKAFRRAFDAAHGKAAQS